MKTLNEVNSTDIKTIFNGAYRTRKEVNQFGQSIPNPNLEDRIDLIDTLDILCDLYDEALEVYDLTAYNMHSLEGTNFEWLEEYETQANNTYNWSAPLTNDLDFRVYKVENHLFVSVAVHNGYSDVRCGYIVEFLYKFDTGYNYEDFNMILIDLPSSNKSFDINGYYFSFDIYSESGVYNVSKFDGTDESWDNYIGDYDDCVKWLQEREEGELC